MKVSNFLALFKDYQQDDEVALINFLGGITEISYVGRDFKSNKVVIEGVMDNDKE